MSPRSSDFGLTFNTNKQTLIGNLHRRNRRIDENLREAVANQLDLAEDDLRARTPERSGFARDNIYAALTGAPSNFVLGWRAEDFNVPETRYRFYIPALEYGTKVMVGAFMLTLTARYARIRMKNAIARAIKNV